MGFFSRLFGKGSNEARAGEARAGPLSAGPARAGPVRHHGRERGFAVGAPPGFRARPLQRGMTLESARQRGNVYVALKDDIDRARRMDDQNVDRQQVDRDYFYLELVARLAAAASPKSSACRLLDPGPDVPRAPLPSAGWLEVEEDGAAIGRNSIPSQAVASDPISSRWRAPAGRDRRPPYFERIREDRGAGEMDRVERAHRFFRKSFRSLFEDFLVEVEQEPGRRGGSETLLDHSEAAFRVRLSPRPVQRTPAFDQGQPRGDDQIGPIENFFHLGAARLRRRARKERRSFRRRRSMLAAVQVEQILGGQA